MHVSFHLALLGSLVVFALISGVFWHLGGREIVGHSIYAVILAFLLLALVVGAVAYPLARRLTKRLERLQRAVESLGAGDLSARVPVEGHDEVAGLAASFNRAAERIEALAGAAPCCAPRSLPRQHLCAICNSGGHCSEMPRQLD